MPVSAQQYKSTEYQFCDKYEVFESEPKTGSTACQEKRENVL
jgi:hypothetical protein